MNVSIHKVKREEYTAIRNGVRLFEHDNPRAFAIVKSADFKNPVLISWRSDAINPRVVTASGGDLVYIGVDERVAGLDRYGDAVFECKLETVLLDIVCDSRRAVIVSELQALVVDGVGRLALTIDFPDIAIDYLVCQDEIEIAFIDGHRERYRLSGE